MQLLTYTVLPQEDGAQVKSVLKNRGVSTGMLRKLKQTNGILLNGQPVPVRQTVCAGQVLTLQLPQTPSPNVQPVPMDLDIVYEDEYVLVVNKPSGVPIHPSVGHHHDSLAGGVAYYLGQKDFVFHPITRLDRYTCGLVLIAKNAVAAANLCQQIKQGDIQKVYYAVTQGIPSPTQGEITHPIARDENSIMKRKICTNGKPALTRYRVEKTNGNKALVCAVPVTGRTHQIRVHLASIGCPLLYDFLYGEEKENQAFLLQCTALTFVHPHTARPISLEIPCDIWHSSIE